METSMSQDLMTSKPEIGGQSVAHTREAQSVQAAMVIAQKFPRDPERALTRILQDCKRPALAEQAVYSYPRGGQTVCGPSIRLAETIARAWGNLDCGIVELETKPGIGNVPGESVMMSYAWDLETNTRVTKVFTVKHIRDTKQASKALTDQRDIYETTANQGARRLRACILAVIPGDIVDSAVKACNKALEGGKGPIIDRVRLMLSAFHELGVTQEMIEKRLGHVIGVTTEAEIVKLTQIFNSLRDNFGQRSDYFEMPGADAQEPATGDRAPITAPNPSVQSIKGQITPKASEAPTDEPGAKEANFSQKKEEKPGRDRTAIAKEINVVAKDRGINVVKYIATRTAGKDYPSGKVPGELSDDEMETILALIKKEKKL
jgi:hypothetical protein